MHRAADFRRRRSVPIWGRVAVYRTGGIGLRRWRQSGVEMFTMAARRKSTKKTATALQKQRTTTAVRATRRGPVKGRSSAKRTKAAVKPKEKSASSKEARKRARKAKAGPSSTREPHEGREARRGLRECVDQDEEERGSRTRKGLDDGETPRTRSEWKRNCRPTTSRRARRKPQPAWSAQEPGTGAAAPHRDKTTSSASHL